VKKILNGLRKEAEGKDSFTGLEKRRRENEDALKEAGYELEFDDGGSGTIERIWKLPPHMYSVRQKGKEYIAKVLRRHSNELQVLKMLNSPISRCDNIIQLLDTVETDGKRARTLLAVLPMLGSVSEQLCFGGGVLRGRFVDLSRDLAKGLTFLHDNDIAHLDIKPANLVYTDNYCLKIIDFDVSVRVKGEDYEIDDYLGSEGWMAPEIGTENGRRQMYSPIRADRYSCGRVFKEFASVHDGNDEGLAEFAGRLMALIPRNRPRLSEWCKANARTRDADDETMGSEDEALVDDVELEHTIGRPLKRLRAGNSDLES